MKEKLQYILNQLKEKNFTTLPESISTGIVYKISYKGNLNSTGYESGFLIMTEGSSIKEHKHEENVERYRPLMGKLIINGIEQKENICLIGQRHSIDEVKELTIIETYKMDKKLLINNQHNKKALQKK